MPGEKTLRGFSNGVVAMFDDAVGGGDHLVITSPRNAPALHPADYLDTCWFHSRVQNYRPKFGPTDVTVNFLSAAGKTTGIDSYPQINVLGQVVLTNYDLLTHNLGYIPPYQVFLNGVAITSGYKIQEVNDGNGLRYRRVSHWADTTKIGISSWALTNASSLAAVSKTLTVVVYEYPQKVSEVSFDRDYVTGRVTMDGGRFDTSERMLRNGLPAESPYDMPIGRTIDIRNGCTCRVDPDGTVVAEANYNGGFTGSAAFQGVIV